MKIAIVLKIFNLFREHSVMVYPIFLPVRRWALKSISLLVTVLSVATLLSASPATAEIKNGSFEISENYFAASWERTGGLVRYSMGHEIRPTDGNHMIQLGTWDDYGFNTAADIEAFLDLTPGSLNGLGNGTMRNGTAIKQEITASPGDIVTFEWDFSTRESRRSTPPLDFAFVSVVCPSETHLEELVDAGLSTLPLAPVFGVGYDGSYLDLDSDHTGFRSFSIKLTSGGACRLGIGIAQMPNSSGYSELFVDNFRLIKLIPDPAADADFDGVIDLRDQCLGTTDGSEVDGLGCSLEQFCSSIIVSGKINYLTCILADWKDDENILLPGDCKVKDGICQPR